MVCVFNQSWPTDPGMGATTTPMHNGVKPGAPSFPNSTMHMGVNGNAAAKKQTVKPHKWSDEEHRMCLRLYDEKRKNYKEIAEMMGTRTLTQVWKHDRKSASLKQKRSVIFFAIFTCIHIYVYRLDVHTLFLERRRKE